MRKHDTDEQMLGDLFATARQEPAEASAAFMASVLADADAVQAGFVRETQATAEGFSLRTIWANLGGWPAVGGLVTATAVGVWLGLTPLTGMSDTVANYLYGSSDSGLSGLNADYAWLDTMGDA